MDTSSDEDVFVVAALCEEALKLEQRKKRMWVHDICKSRRTHGEYHTLFPLLVRDEKKFFKYFRMSYEKFQELLNVLKEDLTKQDTFFRESVGPEERLAVCLRFLSTGDSFGTIAFNFRLGQTTVRSIVHETCEAIWRRLSPRVLPEPTAETWRSIEKTFSERWNFPNCIGALDGKHIVIEAPRKTGSLYFNYKKTFSIVLMALVDADYRFIAVDVGAYGKSNDSGIFSKSALGKALNEGRLNIPDDKPLPGSEDPVPHVIVGDEAFPLQTNIMRPYPGSQLGDDESKKIFNYRLSRARRISENAFGILAQKFRIFFRRIKINPERADNIVLAACCLHNFMLTINDSVRTSANTNGNSSEGLQEIGDIVNIACNRGIEAVAVRETFRKYFYSPVGSVPWQTEMVRTGKRTR